jgi:hypothetical protein
MWRGLVFSNLYVAALALLMLQFSVQALHLSIPSAYFPFVFFATLSSYCLHWALSDFPHPRSRRERWNVQNRPFLCLLCLFSGLIAVTYLWALRSYWAYILPIILLTLAYTLPKVEHPWAFRIRPLARQKTLYLTLVWALTTLGLPLLMSKQAASWVEGCFLAQRFIHLYAICLLFDFRDSGREARHLSWAMRSSAQVFQRRLALIIGTGLFVSMALLWAGSDVTLFLACSTPTLLLWFARKKPSLVDDDLWYDGVLDGLAAAGGIIFIVLD